MTRVGHILKGLCALGLLAGIAAGTPWALWHFIGWPLPHHVPSLAQLGHALDQRGIPDQALIDALAAVVWVTWAVLVASIAVEVPAALAGRRAPRLPLAGIFQPVTGRLVAAVIVAALSFAPRTTQVTALGSLGGGLSTLSGRQQVATLVLTGATQPLLATSKPATTDLSTPEAATASTNSSRTYVVQRGDTLWGIAERQLGDPLDWSEIYQLNEGRAQPDGRALTDPHWIYPGWTLVLPPAAHGPAGGHGAGDTSVPPRHKSVPTSTTSPTRGNGTGGAGSGVRVGPVSVPASHSTTSTEARHEAPSSTAPGRTSESKKSGDAGRSAETTTAPARAPIAPIGFGLLGAGLLGALVRLRRVQQRHRRLGRRIPLPTGDLAQVEQALAASRDPDAPWFVDRALRLLTGLLRDTGPVPAILGAVLRPETLELMLDGEAAAPAPFTNAAPDRWLLARDDETTRIALADAKDALAALPCLVTIGADAEGVVLLNLAAGGRVALDGDPVVATELATAIALELASAPWNETLELIDIGVGTEQVGRGRCTTASSIDEVLPLLRAQLKSVRSEHIDGATMAPSLVATEPRTNLVLISTRPISPAEQASLTDEIGDPGQVGIAIVAPGSLQEASWRLVATADGQLEVTPLSRQVQAQRVSTTHLAGIAALLGLAARRGDVASDTPPYATFASTGSSLTGEVPKVEVPTTVLLEGESVAPSVAPSAEATPLPTVELAARRGDVASDTPPYATIASTGSPSTAEVPKVDVPTTVLLEGESVEPSVAPSAEATLLATVEVGVLGPLEIRGIAAAPQRSKATELIAWLVLHNRHGSTDEVATALWPMGASEGSQHNVIWDARRALGEDADGNSLLVREGGLKLSPLVTSDWAHFRELACCDDRDTRVAALSLVRGKPFGDVDWPWSTVEGLAATMEAEVCDLASAMGEQSLLDGDASLAAHAAEQGILASPYDERLYRLLMRASDALGNPAGVRSAMGRLAAVLEDDVEPLESSRSLKLSRPWVRRTPPSSALSGNRSSSGYVCVNVPISVSLCFCLWSCFSSSRQPSSS
jgi:DNA-binding SARP family transcriptional activator